NRSKARSFFPGSLDVSRRSRRPGARGRTSSKASRSNGSCTSALRDNVGPGGPKTAAMGLPVLQVIPLHLGLVPIRLAEQEIDLGGLSFPSVHPVAEGLQLRLRRPQLAEELDRGHRPLPLLLEALQVLQRDLEGVRDLTGPLLLRIRDIEDEPADHRLARWVVPQDVRQDGEVVFDRVGAALEPRLRADDREALLVPSVGQVEALRPETAPDLRDGFEERTVQFDRGHGVAGIVDLVQGEPRVSRENRSFFSAEMETGPNSSSGRVKRVISRSKYFAPSIAPASMRIIMLFAAPFGPTRSRCCRDNRARSKPSSSSWRSKRCPSISVCRAWNREGWTMVRCDKVPCASNPFRRLRRARD